MTITIKKVTDFPFAEITELWNDAFSDYLVPVKMTEAQLAHRISSLGLLAEKSLVALVDQNLAGIVLYGEQSYQKKKQGWIGGMAVKPAYRQRGIAKELMLSVIDEAKRANNDELLLEVIAKNHGAVMLYEQLGFTAVSRLTNGGIEVSQLPENTQKNVSLTAPLTIEEVSELERPLTIWQNRLGTPGELRGIKILGELSGYGFFVLNKEQNKVVIKQLVLKEQRQTILVEILKMFGDEFGCQIVYLSNFDVKNPVIEQVKEFEFKEETKQIQMKLFYKK